jgi:hypothetical protein
MSRYLFITLLLFAGCANQPSYRSVKKHFTNKLEGGFTGLDSLIDINGYYSMRDLSHERENPDYRYNIIFFKDGMFARQFFPSWLPAKVEDVENFGASEWGVYRIEGDTIKTQGIHHGTWIVPYGGLEEWYKIINKTCIKNIYGKFLPEQKEFYSYMYYSPAEFIPLSIIPSSDHCWLRYDKHFWRNESDWKAYRERRKMEKRLRKKK